MEPKQIRMTILGCGTSSGVPLLFCDCSVCRSKDPKNKRTRASLYLEILPTTESQPLFFLVDVSPDFRDQVRKNKIRKIDSILFTHPHADHVGGIDEIRSFNFIQKSRIPAWAHSWTKRDLIARFPYIFKKIPTEGGGVAGIDLNQFSLNAKNFQVKGVTVIPLEVHHGSQKVAGFRVGNFAYVTDCHAIPNKTLKRLKGLDLLILDCLRYEPHSTHLHFEEALRYAAKIDAKRTIFTHLGHEFDYKRVSKTLPKNCALAYDGMSLTLKRKSKG